MGNSLQFSRQSVHARGDESARAAIHHYPADALFYLDACLPVAGQRAHVPVAGYRDVPYSPAECAAVAARLGVPVRRMMMCDL